MADKYLSLDLTTGKQKRVEATVVSTGVSEAGDIPALDSTGKLDVSVFPSGMGAETKTANAGENLSAGDFVYIGAAGTVLKADATITGKEADGFVLTSVTSGNSATIHTDGINNQLSSLTVGSRYYLSTTAGGVTEVVSAYVAGNVVQVIGKALSATEILFEGDKGTIL